MGIENAGSSEQESLPERRDRREFDSRFATLEEKVSRMEHFLFGNGKEGAIDRLFKLHDELAKKQDADVTALRSEMKDGFHAIALILENVKNVVGVWKMLGTSLGTVIVTLLATYFFKT